MPKIAWTRQVFNAYNHIKKGEKVYAMDYGIATTTKKGQLVGFALETNADESTKLVEVALRLINN